MKKRFISGLLAALLVAGTLPAAQALYDESLPEPRPGEFQITAIPENVTGDVYSGDTVDTTRPGIPVIAAPQERMTRIGVVTSLWELAGKPQVDASMTFTDVEADGAIRWAAVEKITNGYDAEHFGPNDSVTREQLAALIYRFAQKYDLGFRGAWMFYIGCSDLDQVAEWAFEPMYWMVANHFYEAQADDLLRPQDTVLISEAQTIFQGLKQVFTDKGVDPTQR